MSGVQKNNHSPRFGNASSSLATTVTSHVHQPHEHVSSSFFPNSLKEGAESFEREFGPVPTSTPSQTKVSTTYVSNPTPSAQRPTIVQTPDGAIRHNAYTTIQPTTIQQDAFTTLHPKGTHFPISHPMIQQAPPPYTPQIQAQTNQVFNKANTITEQYQLAPDRMHQLVRGVGIARKDFSHNGYFEKMSSGSVFARKTLLPTSYAAVPLSFAALGTTIGLLHSPAAAAAAGSAFIGTTGGAIGTGVGAAGLGAIIAGYLGWTGYRSAKVMKGYKQFLGKIKAELLKPGNENAVRWYLRTISSGSAKSKVKKCNARTQMQLDSVQNPKIASHPVYKIYMRYARNQNAVFVTRNPEYARALLAEADRRAADRENMK